MWRKITCHSKSSIWMKPSYSGKGWLKGLSIIRRPSQCQVSRFVYIHSMTFAWRWNYLMTHFSECISVVKQCMNVCVCVCVCVCVYTERATGHLKFTSHTHTHTHTHVRVRRKSCPAHTMEKIGKTCTVQLIPNLDTKWRWGVNIMPLLF